MQFGRKRRKCANVSTCSLLTAVLPIIKCMQRTQLSALNLSSQSATTRCFALYWQNIKAENDWIVT